MMMPFKGVIMNCGTEDTEFSFGLYLCHPATTIAIYPGQGKDISASGLG
ncbi:hypothetical protein [Janthinobacterium sp. J1-1]|nr:hypothetical protein [Janthinobacterium sp. J1-1]